MPQRPRLVVLVLALAVLLLGAAAWILVDSGRPAEPSPAAPPAPVEVVAPAPRPVIEEVAAAPAARKVPALPQLPPDPIRARIEAGEKLYTLFGEVLDAVSKEPVRSFSMVCIPTRSGNLQQLADDPHKVRTWQNPLGTFTYRGLEPGRYDLLIRVLNYEDLVVENVQVPNPIPKLTYLLNRGPFVEGTVVALDEDGDEEGLGGIEVRLKPIALDDPYATVIAGLQVTNDDGKFLFSKVAPGTYEVALGNPRLAPQSSQQIYVSAAAGIPIRFVVPEQNGITVHVRDVNGAVLGDAHVRLWLKDGGYGMVRGDTDSDGECELDHVPPGDYLLKVWKHKYEYHTQDLVLNGVRDDVEVDVVLELDTRDYEHLTKEELERLKAGERPESVFGKKKD